MDFSFILAHLFGVANKLDPKNEIFLLFETALKCMGPVDVLINNLKVLNKIQKSIIEPLDSYKTASKSTKFSICFLVSKSSGPKVNTTCIFLFKEIFFVKQ